MALVRLIYSSKTTPAFSGKSLRDIIDISRQNNSKQFITGCLFLTKTILFNIWKVVQSR